MVTRRLVLIGLGLTSAGPARVLAKTDDLPECEAEDVVGPWEVSVSNPEAINVFRGSLDHTDTDFFVRLVYHWDELYRVEVLLDNYTDLGEHVGRTLVYDIEADVAGRKRMFRAAKHLKESAGSTAMTFRGDAPIETPAPFVEALRDGEYMRVRAGVVANPDDRTYIASLAEQRIQLRDSAKALDRMNALRQQIAKARAAERCEPGCFVTEAVCGELGFSETCFELRHLRAFRDSWLARQPGGPSEIAVYYALAPRIVSRIENSRARRRILAGLYARHIAPAAIAAALGQNRLAHRIYRGMLRSLIDADTSFSGRTV